MSAASFSKARSNPLCGPWVLGCVGVFTLLFPQGTYPNPAQRLFGLLPARQFISAGLRGERMAELLEVNRGLYLQHMAMHTQGTGFSTIEREIQKNLNILKHLSRTDRISLEKAEKELADINKELAWYKSLVRMLGFYEPEVTTIIRGNEYLLTHAQALAETRLLVAEVHEAGADGIAIVRKRLKASLEEARRQRYALSGNIAPLSESDFLEQEEKFAREVNRLQNKLRILTDLEITLSGDISRSFAQKGPNATLAEAESLARVLREQLRRLEQNMGFFPDEQTVQSRNSLLHTLEEANQRVELIKQEIDAWTAALHVQ